MSAPRLQIDIYYNTNGTKIKSREQGKKKKKKKKQSIM